MTLNSYLSASITGSSLYWKWKCANVCISVLYTAQVESLFHNFHTRRTLRINVLGKGKKAEKKPETQNKSGQAGGTEEPELTNNSNSDTEEWVLFISLLFLYFSGVTVALSLVFLVRFEPQFSCLRVKRCSLIVQQSASLRMHWHVSIGNDKYV